MSQGTARTRLLLRCLGAASLSALAVTLVEVALALMTRNALLSASSSAGQARLLGLVVLSFPALAIPSAVMGFALASIRPRMGTALCFALPALLVAGECLRIGGTLQGSAAVVLGWTALALGLGLAALSMARELVLPGRLTLGALAGAIVLLAGLQLVSPDPAAGEGEAPASTPLAAPSEEPWKPARNLLVLLVDTLRADHLGCYGYARDTSPRIDAFARQGTLFENAATPKPKTSPAVASLFTGTWPQTHRVHAARTELLEENVTLAETLQEAGFATFGISANTNINKTLGFGQGFDELRWLTRVELGNGELIDNHAGQLAAQVIRWLEQHRDERFLAYAHLIDPHSPYRPPAPYAEMFRGDGLDGELGSSNQKQPGAGYIERVQKSVYLPEAGYDLDAYVARYDGEIRFTDEAIGAILDALERLGLADSTVVVFLSDHGESIVEHHAWFNHGLFPYEEQIHVPLLLRGPGIAVGQRRPEQVSLVGLMATLLELLGVSPPEQIEVSSFAALLRADAPAHAGQATLLCAREDTPSMTWGLRTNRWKYLLNPGKHAPHEAARLWNLLWPARRLAFTLDGLRNYQLEEELYDLRADPEELENLAYREPEVRARMRARMEALRAASKPVSQAPRVLSSREFSDEARRDLMRLGYMGR